MFKRLRCEWYHYEMACHHEGSKPTLREFVWGLLRYDRLVAWAAERYCDRFGHDWVDTSTGGPESGDMSGYCKRCGYSFHHQLY
jgi:hypothetical protein